MQVFKFISIIFLLLLISLGTKAQEKKAKEIKVLEWNIWHGGKGESLPVKDARPEIINIIKHSEADVVLMIETYGAAEVIAKGLGYYYTLLSDNLCIFSRFPISKTLLFTDKISSFNLGGAEIIVNNKIPMLFFDTWLHYLPDCRLAPVEKSEMEIIRWEKSGSRDEEITSILKTIEPFLKSADQTPVVLGGDFNTHSHLDWTDETRNLFNHRGAVVEWPVSKALADAGMKDSFREVNCWPVANIGVTWLGGENADGTPNHSRQDRIDYIYYKGASIKAVESEIFVAPEGRRFNFHGQNFMYPSDHGFVLTTFRIN
jgi:hypothetical protein